MAVEIPKLTPEQTARIPEWIAKWTAIGLSTAPADRPRAEAGIRGCYRAAGLAEPKVIVWAGSPLSGAIAAAVMGKALASGFIVRDGVGASVRGIVEDSVWASVGASVGVSVDDSVWASVGASVGASVWESVRSGVRASVRNSVRDKWSAFMDANFDAAFMAWVTFFSQVCGVAGIAPQYTYYADTVESCGWWWPYSSFCVVSERPRELHRDDRGRLHCETGPAISWPDGWGIYSWHGVRVSQQVIEAPQTLTIAQIKGETNAEVRRVMRERFGEGRYLAEIGAKLIDADGGNGRAKGSAPRVLLEDDERQRWLVGTDGSTRRVYHMPVPATAKTCREAHEAISGLPEARCLAES